MHHLEMLILYPAVHKSHHSGCSAPDGAKRHELCEERDKDLISYISPQGSGDLISPSRDKQT